ncbi:glycosyltransferase family 4 protein [Patescibacteria group bacterium]|nr:glycosyltransferase family 4 protein [Patescibacteria group bacterium]MBU1705536.1 glycosyltransferase family 4 protein [Patescibacteria group bacterium]
MRIGIDARMYGPKVGGGGLGRYVEQLINQLQTIDHQNRYVLFLKPENYSACALTNKNFSKQKIDLHWYTLREQLSLAKKIDAAKLDLVHFPHWNVPLNLKTPFVVTIHDLILLEEPLSSHASTRHPLIHRVKYQGFKIVLRRALTKSQKIIAVSEYTKQSILKYFPQIPADKITVIYEGVTNLTHPSSTLPPPSLPTSPPAPYFLYVGNAYPHKNLESLMHAFSFFNKIQPEVKLVLAGRQDSFYEGLKKELSELDVPAKNIIFKMNPSDQELQALYQSATLYLFPSRSEGFGLPALEAMQAGTPVAAADNSSLPEILGDAALYFAPDDLEAMVAIMKKALADKKLRQELTDKGYQRIKQFSWTALANQTLAIYQSAS